METNGAQGFDLGGACNTQICTTNLLYYGFLLMVVTAGILEVPEYLES